jgi:excisionase family DNA binding protein
LSLNDPALALPRLLTVREAAAALGCSQRKLFDLTAPRGPVPAVKIGGRVRYNARDLEEFIAASTVRQR